MFLGSMGCQVLNFKFGVNFSAEFEGNGSWVLLGFCLLVFLSVFLSHRGRGGVVVTKSDSGFCYLYICTTQHSRLGFPVFPPKNSACDLHTLSQSLVCVRVVMSD